jgi:hemin uptake protein HemP
MTKDQNRTEREPQDRMAPQAARLLQAAELFRGEKEVWIEHEGVRYRLRITRRNKLILQK